MNSYEIREAIKDACRDIDELGETDTQWLIGLLEICADSLEEYEADYYTGDETE